MAFTLAGFALSFCWPSFPVLSSSGPERVAVWAAASATVAFWVVVAIARLARHRFLSDADIDGGASSGGTVRARTLQAMLQNTLEQAFLAVIAYAAWIALIDARFGALPVLFAGYFTLGRILFFAGYARGAPARALGFGLTFYPSACLIVVTAPIGLSRLVAALKAAG